MRDGARLRTFAAVPLGVGPFPAILVRSPYPFSEPPTAGYDFYAQRGYAVVVQYVRGRYGSEGEWLPYLNEGQDGYDAIGWIARQPWSDGQVAMMGGSYVGWTQVAAALEGHPALKAIVPHASPYPPIPSLGASGGTFLFHQVPLWAAAVHGSVRNDISQMPWERILRSLPVLEALDGKMGEAWHRRCVSSFREMQAHFYTRADYSQIPPAQCIAGWHDHILHDALDLHTRVSEGRLILGPWSHGDYGRVVGDVDMGDQVGSLAELQRVQSLRWLDWYLKGIDTRLDAEPPVRLFVTGENRWRFVSAWPPPRAEPTARYLHSRGGAGGVDDPGHLSQEPPGQEPPDRYAYDPRDPVPTLGGANSGPCGDAGLRRGPVDQRATEVRSDVLVYRSEPLDRDLEVIGAIQVHLFVATDALDTDFTAKIVDVYPDGQVMGMQDGILRCRYRESYSEELLMEPGAVYEIRIDIPPIGHVFGRGHRIGLHVSSSNFPRFDRNLNTGLDNERTAEHVVAHQTVYHDRRYPSRLVLPTMAKE
jgi:putative CocE/NonD family hydrolase